MDTFKINQLKVQTFLGTYPFEQKVKQPVVLDLEYTLDTRPAAKTNALNDTVDYSRLAAQLTQFIEQQAFVLIENMAEQITQFLKQEFALSQVKLKITKIGCLPNAKEVSLEVVR